MKKIQKTAIIFIILLIQSAAAIAGGVFALSYFSGDKLPVGLRAGGVDIGGLSRQEAVKQVKNSYDSLFQNGKLQITVKDGKAYTVPYSDFEAAVDAQATIDSIPKSGSGFSLSAFENTFAANAGSVAPVIRFNESKLRKLLIEWAKETDRQPVNAMLSFKDGKIVQIPEQDGQKLDISNAVDQIRQHLTANPEAVLEFSRYSNTGLVTVQPEQKLKDLQDIDTILAEYSTKLIYPEFTDAIEQASGAINGILLTPAGTGGNALGSFAFVERLQQKDSQFENDNEGYDQVASTLYAAVLSAGIDKGSITRLAHEIPVDYIEPGLDAWISGNGGELKFSNTLSHTIALFSSIQDGRLVIRIAGNSQDQRQNTELKSEITERTAPPVFNVEDATLKKGEKVVLDPGKEGLSVKVTRGEELISRDTYAAVKKVVQIGPDTDWADLNDDK